MSFTRERPYQVLGLRSECDSTVPSREYGNMFFRDYIGIIWGLYRACTGILSGLYSLIPY